MEGDANLFRITHGARGLHVYAHTCTIRPLVRLSENDSALFFQRLGLGHGGLSSVMVHPSHHHGFALYSER
jgi:hypothetical protein